MMTKRRIRKPKKIEIDAEFVNSNASNLESTYWEFYDTQTITKNQLVSRYKDFRFFAEPVSSSKALSETNMQQGSILCAPQQFKPYVLEAEVLKPYNDYIKDTVQNNWIVEFWLGCKLYGQTSSIRLDLSYCPIIKTGFSFGVLIKFNQDFMLMEDVRIKVKIFGKLDRPVG